MRWFPTSVRGVRATVAVALVLALSGLIFTVSARLASGGGRNPENVAQLVSQESDRVARLTGEIEALSAEIDTLGNTGHPSSATGTRVVNEGVDAGTVSVTGPGLTVSLDDAPPDATYEDGIHPDDLVVHQQDLQGVINALWAGGAEAMTLQGQRVTATSAFRCAGNILLLHGRVYSPPYVVSAIGNPTLLQQALDASPQVNSYRQWVSAVNLGWSVSVSDSLNLPRYQGVLDLKYAQAIGEEG